jgi:glycosyltransferase involved in cell wall biosynthesis
MNILLSVNNLGLGGVTTYVYQLANGLSARHKVVLFDHYPYASVLTNTPGGPVSFTVENTLKYPLKDQWIWRMNRLLQMLGKKASVWEKYRNHHFLDTIKKNNIDIIISFDRFSDQVVTHLKRRHRKPVVLSLHGNYDRDTEKPWTEDELERFRGVFAKTDGIIYKNEKNIALIRETGSFPSVRVMRQIMHGYKRHIPEIKREDLRKVYSLPVEAFIFTMVARGDSTKGWKEALDAFLMLRDSQPGHKDYFYFLAKGDGQYMNIMKEEYSTLQGLIFLDDAIPAWHPMAMADVGVLPSYFKTENYSFSVIEYLNYGLPVIASDHGNIPDTLRAGDSVAGTLVPLSSSGKCDPALIMKAMNEYWSDRDLLQYHRSLTETAILKFDLQRAVEEYEDILLMLIKN